MEVDVITSWWSAGVTSAVASKIALEKYEDVNIYYMDTGSGHPDNDRFKADCEKWYGKEIITVKSKKYSSVEDVIRKTRYVNGVAGARCTKELKINVRLELEKELKGQIDGQVFGFHYSKHEQQRAKRFLMEYPYTNPLFPLIENKLTKEDCFLELQRAGIQIPTMYKLGYNNNNCIGCVKGGKGYWNKIREDFPDVFNAMAKLERECGHSCTKTFLDELPKQCGRHKDFDVPDCGLFCYGFVDNY